MTKKKNNYNDYYTNKVTSKIGKIKTLEKDHKQAHRPKCQIST